MLEDLTPEEVVAVVHLISSIQDGTAVFIGDTLHMLDEIPGIESLAKKVNEAGDRDDVKEYMRRVYGSDVE